MIQQQQRVEVGRDIGNEEGGGRDVRTRHQRDHDLRGRDIDGLNSKAETLRTGWRTGVGNELFEDESLVIMIYEDESSVIMIYKDRTLTSCTPRPRR